MAIERAAILYPAHIVTVDTGAGIDIRGMRPNQGAANIDTNTATFDHTNDSIERTFDPATAAVNTINAGTTLARLGYAIPLATGMTPANDGEGGNVCNACLLPGTVTVKACVGWTQTGGTYAVGTAAPTWRASLWRYNPATDAGVLIAGGSAAAPLLWDYAAVPVPPNVALGTFQVVSIPIVVASLTEFAEGEVLLLQIGLNTGTVPNPSLGTAAHVATLRINNAATTELDFAAGQGVRQACAYTINNVGKGTAVLNNRAFALARTAVGKGTATAAKGVTASKTFSLVGKGAVTHTKAAGIPRTLTGRGTIAGTITVPLDELPAGDVIVRRVTQVFDD